MIILLAPVAAAFAFLGFIVLRRWPIVGAIALLIFTATEWEVPFPPALVSIAGANIFPLDLICGLMLAVAAAQLGQFKSNIGAARFAWFGLTALLLYSLVRGVVVFGPASSVNEMRTFLYPYATITWGMSLAWTKRLAWTLVGRASLAQGWILCLVAVFHIAVYGFGQADEELMINGVLRNQRPLISAQAIVLLFCAVAVFALARRAARPAAWRISGVVFLVFVLLVQERTVWGAALAVAAGVLVLGSLRQKGQFVSATAIAVLVIVVAQPVLVTLEPVAALSESSTSTGTYEGRVNSWLALIDQINARGFQSVLFGLPSGSGWGRFEGPGRWVEWYPHNWYVSIYLRTGILGLALMVAFIGLAGWRLTVNRRVTTANVLVLLGTVVYGWGYGWQAETGVLLGAALSGRLGVADEAPTPEAIAAIPLVRPRQLSAVAARPHRRDIPSLESGSIGQAQRAE